MAEKVLYPHLGVSPRTPPVETELLTKLWVKDPLTEEFKRDPGYDTLDSKEPTLADDLAFTGVCFGRRWFYCQNVEVLGLMDNARYQNLQRYHELTRVRNSSSEMHLVPYLRALLALVVVVSAATR